jgi:hypothetical protein
MRNLFLKSSLKTIITEIFSTMKKITYFIFFICLTSLPFISCKKENLGLPDNIISTTPDSVLIAKQIAIFNPGQSIGAAYPVLFDTIHEKRIILTKDALVFVTFLHEGASWTNSFGYYTYLNTDPPSTSNKSILFPNISGDGSGGGLKVGDMVQIGTGVLPKGTVIGFYLVAQGWNTDSRQMTNGLYTHYTDKIFNINQSQQSIIFVEKTTGKLVLGFEDELRGDMDCKDIIVSVSDTRDPKAVPTSFDLANVPVIGI